MFFVPREKQEALFHFRGFRRSVEKSLKPSSGWNRLVEDAGEAGTRDEDCGVLYRDCEESVSSKDHGASKT